MNKFFETFQSLSNRSNRFQSTCGQVELLKELNYPFHEKTATEWLDCCDQLGFTENIFFEEDKAVFEDQVLRAINIAETFWRGDYQILVMMDGHGRMLYRILRALQTWDVNIDQIQIYIVDLDQATHEWHQHFFPQNVTNMKNDILSLLESHPVNEDRVLPYLNFCGLQDQQKRVWEFVTNWLGKSDLIISFSTRGVKKSAHVCSDLKNVSGLVGRLLKLQREGKSSTIAHRAYPPFTTYQIFKEN